jgi:hypothetical protein
MHSGIAGPRYRRIVRGRFCKNEQQLYRSAIELEHEHCQRLRGHCFGHGYELFLVGGPMASASADPHGKFDVLSERRGHVAADRRTHALQILRAIVGIIRDDECAGAQAALD